MTIAVGYAIALAITDTSHPSTGLWRLQRPFQTQRVILG